MASFQITPLPKDDAASSRPFLYSSCKRASPLAPLIADKAAAIDFLSERNTATFGHIFIGAKMKSEAVIEYQNGC